MSTAKEIIASLDLLNKVLSALVEDLGDIPIGDDGHFPFGWRKAAKGRTVWRLIEEAISQNLEINAQKLGLENFSPASSEVGVYDFSYSHDGKKMSFVNIKSAVQGARKNKDDISKAIKLQSFLEENNDAILLIASIEISFSENPMRVSLERCYIVPITWLPDVYVNPSNNGNLQSSKYKDFDVCVRRSNEEFLKVLSTEIEVAKVKKATKAAKAKKAVK